jgi:small-conductance mechanosensitive channel
MKTSHKLVLLGLLVFAFAAVVGLRLTSDSLDIIPRFGPPRRVRATKPPPVVDQRSLETANKLAPLAITPNEQQFAKDAVRAADHDVTLAFAAALRAANRAPKPHNAATQALDGRINQLEAEIQADEDKIKELKARAAKARESLQDSIQAQLELVQADEALNQDELEDAKEDLVRAGGDPRSQIQRLMAEHDAAERAAAPVQPSSGNNAPAEGLFSTPSLVNRWRVWNTLRDTHTQLLEAQQEAQDTVTKLTQAHDALSKHVQEGRAQKKAMARAAASRLAVPQVQAGEDSKQVAAAAVESLHSLSEDQKDIAELNKRIQDQQELAATYAKWISSVQGHQRASLNRIIRSALWMVIILLLVFAADRLIDHFFTRFTSDRKQLLTLRGVVRFAAEALGVLAILYLILGAPNQMPTILGLAGAGLTVALKDFIVAFFGWFVLMGRHGVRVGDRVEINGVSGEVVEIGLLRTVLLEAGNWTDSGHPTGRQVAFVNSYAVEGHYFNFSTSGQWLWDEVRFLLPPDENPRGVFEEIQTIVAKETENNSRLAEQEWQRVTHRYGVSLPSVSPTINVRSTSGGVEAAVRYITRADQRSEVRSRLNHAIVLLLHGKKGAVLTPEHSPTPPGASSG